jgi:hypothetical protein
MRHLLEVPTSLAKTNQDDYAKRRKLVAVSGGRRGTRSDERRD